MPLLGAGFLWDCLHVQLVRGLAPGMGGCVQESSVQVMPARNGMLHSRKHCRPRIATYSRPASPAQLSSANLSAAPHLEV